MSQAYISKALRDRVAAKAKYRCGYCLTQEAVVGSSMEIDHIIPEVLGGATEEENLWSACSAWNEQT
jgi:5-methylcytosine-specific restriction endonuclease McrA